MRQNLLREITFSCCKTLSKQEVVLPSTYLETFRRQASQLHLDIENYGILKQEIDKDFKRIDLILHHTMNNLVSLTTIAKDAISAIDKGDGETINSCIESSVRLGAVLQKLKQDVYIDDLTAALKRRWIYEEYLHEMKFTNKGAMVLVDMDSLKSINDTFGHSIGDNILIFFVDFIKANIKLYSNIIVRYAGDEFLLFFGDDYSVEEVERIILTTQEKLSTKLLKTSKNETLKFSFSYGIIGFSEGDGFFETFDAVDKAMYEQKNAKPKIKYKKISPTP